MKHIKRLVLVLVIVGVIVFAGYQYAQTVVSDKASEVVVQTAADLGVELSSEEQAAVDDACDALLDNYSVKDLYDIYKNQDADSVEEVYETVKSQLSSTDAAALEDAYKEVKNKYSDEEIQNMAKEAAKKVGLQ